MSNKKRQETRDKRQVSLVIAVMSALLVMPAFAEDDFDAGVPPNEQPVAYQAVEMEGPRPVFQQIAELEQEKILLQLEKEKAQIMLDLDRMAAEQSRIRNELNGTSNKAEAELRKLEAEREKLEAERENLRKAAERASEPREVPVVSAPVREERAIEAAFGLSEKYRLIDIIGTGRQLQATLEDLKTGQKKKVWAGREIDGYEVRSISLDDGVVFEKDGEIEMLGVVMGKE